MPDDATTYIGQLSADGRWRWNGKAWTAAEISWPAWASLKLRTQATWPAAVATLVVGLIADQALRVGAFGAAASAFVVSSAVILLLVGRVKRVESWLLAMAAAAFGAWLTLRASPWLLWPDLAATLVLLSLAGSIAIRGSLLDLGMAEAASRTSNAMLHALCGAGFVGRPVFSSKPRLAAAAPVARGLVIAIPIAAVLAALLASADPIFASFLRLNFDLGRLSLDAIYVGAGLLVMAGLLRLAAAEPTARVDGPAWRLGTTEAMIVLGVIDAVFGAFAVAQAIGASGTGADTLRAAGVTYADYARSGFFQLLWVAGLSLVVLALFSRITSLAGRSRRIAFTLLAETAIILTLLIVLVASERLSLYESAYGFTMLRLYSHLFAGWVAVIFLLLAADIGGLWPRRRWFLGATTIAALSLLMVLNAVNPEAVVVSLNVERAVATHKIDAQYFGGLSSDAVPALVESTARGGPSISAAIRQVACAGSRTYGPSPAAFNFADAAAADARRRGC